MDRVVESLQLDHLNLTVTDLERTIEWYGCVFGFEVVERDIQDGVSWAVLRAGDSMLCVYEYPDREPPGRFELDARGLHGMNHFSFRIADVADWEATVERESLAVRYGGVVEWPHSRSWYVRDPTGYEIEVTCWHRAKPDFAGRPISVAGRPSPARRAPPEAR